MIQAAQDDRVISGEAKGYIMACLVAAEDRGHGGRPGWLGLKRRDSALRDPSRTETGDAQLYWVDEGGV